VQSGQILAGKYRLLRKIGQGAMGEVWAALHTHTERHVAVKFVTSTSRDHRERLLREARALGRIQQRNVTDVVDLGETDDGAPFLVMEFLAGETLEHRIKRQRTLPPTVAAAFGADIARGLAAAHAVGAVHRDLKPANIFLHRAPDGETVVKVLDFGVSKLLTEESTATMTGVAVGSPAYMSPEQARGEKNLDARSDLWALGVVVFEMVAGRRPFLGESSFDTVAEILRGPIPSLADCAPQAPPDLVAFVGRCLQRAPSERLASADEAVAWLSAVAQGRPLVPGEPLLRASFLTEPVPSQPLPLAPASGPVNTTAPAVHTQAPAPRRSWKVLAVAGGGLALLALVVTLRSPGPAVPAVASPDLPTASAALSSPEPLPSVSVAASVSAAPPLSSSTPAKTRLPSHPSKPDVGTGKQVQKPGKSGGIIPLKP
jgi:serine/threonine-protein kinase